MCVCVCACVCVFVCVSQVALCFSPVGSKLRLRSRKFPAVVNCTAIDWFHEWPQEALESVSLRFLQEVENIEVRTEGLGMWSGRTRACTRKHTGTHTHIHAQIHTDSC